MCETNTKKAIVLGTFLMSLCIFQCFGAVFEDMEDGRTATIICDGFLGFIHSLLVIGAFRRQRQNILSADSPFWSSVLWDQSGFLMDSLNSFWQESTKKGPSV